MSLGFYIFLSFALFGVCNAIAYARFREWANPVALFTVIHFFYSVSFSLTQWIFDTQTFIRYSDASMASVRAVAISCYFAYCLVVLVPSYRKKSQANSKSCDGSLVCIVGYYVMFVGAWVYSVVFGAAAGAYGEGQSLTALGAFSPIGVLLLFRTFLPAMAIAFSLHSGRRVRWSVYGLILTLELVSALFAGGRRGVVLVALSMLFSYLFFSRLRAKVMLYLFVCGACILALSTYFVQMRGNLRVMNYSDAFLAGFSSLSSMSVEDGIADALNATNCEPLNAWVNDVMIDDSVVPLHGMSYLQAAVNLVVPRPFQGDLVDFQAAYYFKYLAYANVEDMGYDFSFLAEALLNWGPLGAWISFAALGMVIRWIYINRFMGFGWRYAYAMCLPILAVHSRNDSTSTFRMVFVACVSYFIVMWFVGRGRRVQN